MNILCVIPYTPTLIRVRPYNLIKALAGRGHSVTLATLWQTDAERKALAEWQARGVEVIAAPLPRARTAWNSLCALPTPEPLQAAYCWSPELMAAIETRLQGKPGGAFDVAHVEHLRGARYALRLAEMTGSGTAMPARMPVVWDSVDCITYLFEQAARRSRSLKSRMLTRLELGRTRRYEGMLARRFDQVLVTSEADRAALRNLAGVQAPTPVPIAVLPNGVDLEYFTPQSAARQTDAVVFSGKMSYHANITAAIFLATQVMPLVWAQRPGARLVIAGSQPGAAIRKLAEAAPERIEVTGYLPDLRVPLQQASVAVAPLLYGAGIQNKVLEAMACATPVVATSLAVAALRAQAGRDCLVADTPQGLAEAILLLLNSPALRAQIGAAGHRYVSDCHNWDAIAVQLDSIYRNVL